MAARAADPNMPYRLDQLGWLQFERLCTLIVEAECGAPALAWRGRADNFCQAFVDEAELTLGTLGVRVAGPLTVAIVWVPAGVPARVTAFDWRIATLSEELGSQDAEGDVLVLTNLGADDARSAPFISATGKRITLLGPAEIGICLDARAPLRSAMPSVLGLRDLTPLVDAPVRARSSLDIEAAQALARVFVSTQAYARAREVLSRHRFAVLTGPPEMGKTAIARMIALAALTDGWEAYECTRPEQVWRTFERERAQVFIADDAFGSTEYRPDAAELWARELGRILAALDERHWLIWTSRPAPLRAGLARVQRERGAERFPSPAEVLVDASHLDLAEKTLILFRHAKERGEGIEAIRTAGACVVEHPYFTPERIRRFVSGRVRALAQAPDRESLLAAVASELSTPTDAMRTSFVALADEHRATLIALLDTPAGLVHQRELAAAIRRHHHGGLSRAPDQLVDRLTDHFLRVGALGIDWVHPSWRDLVIDRLRSDGQARRLFLERCGLYGAMLALSVEGGRGGERSLPLLVADSDWDTFTDTVGRLVRELDDHDVTRLLLASLAAAQATIEKPVGRELESLLVHELSAARRRWDTEGRALPVVTLEAWLQLNATMPGALEPPALTTTWAELHPGPLDGANAREGLVRADEWLALAEALIIYAPDTASAFGFPERDVATLRSLLDVACAVDPADGESCELAERVVRRVWRLVPSSAVSARVALQRLLSADDASTQWWIPRDIAAPPSTELASLRQTDFTRGDIGRVLADL